MLIAFLILISAPSGKLSLVKCSSSRSKNSSIPISFSSNTWQYFAKLAFCSIYGTVNLLPKRNKNRKDVYNSWKKIFILQLFYINVYNSTKLVPFPAWSIGVCFDPMAGLSLEDCSSDLATTCVVFCFADILVEVLNVWKRMEIIHGTFSRQGSCRLTNILCLWSYVAYPWYILSSRSIGSLT